MCIVIIKQKNKLWKIKLSVICSQLASEPVSILHLILHKKYYNIIIYEYYIVLRIQILFLFLIRFNLIFIKIVCDVLKIST